MKTTTKSKVLHFAVFLLFLLSLFASGNTYMDYRKTQIMLSTAEVLRPTPTQSILDTIESNLGKSQNATDILTLLKYQQKIAATQHEIWLNYVQSQQIILRNQLIMCFSLLGLSLTALITIYWRQNAP